MAGKKLLVADDSLTIQKVIRLALSHEGYEIQAVSEGNEAIEQILLFRPRLVLIDVSLPGKVAVEVKAAIDSKPELAGTQFVLMSSAFESVDEASVGKAGFTARLTKPFDPAHLRKLVSEAFGDESAVAPPPIPSSSVSPPAFNPPPSLPDDSDIRQLTQSTLKMAGLDDLDWSVNEPSRKDIPAPGLPPLPSMDTLPTLAPPAAVLGSPMLGSATSTSDASAAYYSPHLDSELPPPVVSQPGQAEAFALPTDDLEALVRQQVEAELHKISKELLPQLAEKILKQEIHRLLNEIP